MEPLPFPLSSRAKPRDLRFRGPFLETRNTILKQNCHLACPRVPWDRTRISCHAAPDIAACAAFVKESSIKCANATKFHRKSGGAKPRDLQFRDLSWKCLSTEQVGFLQ